MMSLPVWPHVLSGGWGDEWYLVPGGGMDLEVGTVPEGMAWGYGPGYGQGIWSRYDTAMGDSLTPCEQIDRHL